MQEDRLCAGELVPSQRVCRFSQPNVSLAAPLESFLPAPQSLPVTQLQINYTL